MIFSIITSRLAPELITEERNVTISVCDLPCSFSVFSLLGLEQIASKLDIINPESLSDGESIQSMQRKIDGGSARLEGRIQSVNKISY